MSGPRFVKAAPRGVPARRVHALELGQDRALCGRQCSPFPSGVPFDPSSKLACSTCAREYQR